jgi:hypothetical protein
MAEKKEQIAIDTVLGSVVLSKGGKAVDGKPESGNYAVRPVEGTALVVMPGHEVVALLKAAFPLCVFTWLSKPAKKADKKADK